MSLTRRNFLGIAASSAGAMLFAPVFSSKPVAALKNWAENLYFFDWGRNYGSATDGCSFPVVAYPLEVQPKLVRHLRNFRTSSKNFNF